MHSRLPSCCNMRLGSFPANQHARAALRAAAFGVAAAMLAACGGDGAPVRRVTIPQGSSFAAASDSLESAGVLGSPRLFRLYASITGRDRAIKAGTYLLEPGLSWNELIQALSAGRGIEQSITVPEGLALRDIVPMLARSIGAPVESLWTAARDTNTRRRMNVPTPNLEGYLFPDTYRFMYGTSAREAVREMVRRFDDVWEPAWDARVAEMGMSRHAVITLASIVEKEARLAEERPVIAAVYHNRLRQGMPLQADPTVQYAIGEHRTRVLYRDLKIDSPYNTYRHRGLPPGPIASPGRASIEAALFPANVPYRYFVAHPDGHHEFRVTFEEHTAARRLVQRRSSSGARGRTGARGGSSARPR
jgi:UPF0755 protein